MWDISFMSSLFSEYSTTSFTPQLDVSSKEESGLRVLEKHKFVVNTLFCSLCIFTDIIQVILSNVRWFHYSLLSICLFYIRRRTKLLFNSSIRSSSTQLVDYKGELNFALKTLSVGLLVGSAYELSSWLLVQDCQLSWIQTERWWAD